MHRLSYLLLVVLVSACATHTIRAPVGDRSQRPVHTPAAHTVRHGDTLYSVAFLYGLRVEQLAEWNALRSPYTIYRGQRLRLKPPPARAPAAQPKPRAIIHPSRPKPRHVAASLPKSNSAPVPSSRPKSAPPRQSAAARRPAPADQRLTWKWPATGALLQRFDADSSGKKGINIAGHSGAPVRAAAPGKVVYAGSGLGGYGRLIIIKHNKSFLSAYAHNRKLIAKEGEWVKQGQIVAHMGRSGTDRVQLHFEIRKRGRPVDPLRYLPKR